MRPSASLAQTYKTAAPALNGAIIDNKPHVGNRPYAAKFSPLAANAWGPCVGEAGKLCLTAADILGDFAKPSTGFGITQILRRAILCDPAADIVILPDERQPVGYRYELVAGVDFRGSEAVFEYLPDRGDKRCASG